VSCHTCDSSALSPRLSKETEPSHPTFPSVLMSRCLHSLLIIQMKWRNPNPSSEGVFVLNHKISIQTISCFMTGKTFKLLLTMQDIDWFSLYSRAELPFNLFQWTTLSFNHIVGDIENSQCAHSWEPQVYPVHTKSLHHVQEHESNHEVRDLHPNTHFVNPGAFPCYI